MEPLPGINQVFSLVLQQERQLNENITIETKVLIKFVGQQSQRMNGKNIIMVSS